MHISLCRLWKLKINYFLCFVAFNNLYSVKVYVAIVPSPSVRDTGTEPLKRNLGKVNDCCDLWMIKLNASKTKIMIVSRWRTMHPQPPPLTIGWTVLKDSDDLDIMLVTFHSKRVFEKHLLSVARAASLILCILSKSWRIFHDRFLLGRCLLGFVLAVLEYYSAVWGALKSVVPDLWLDGDNAQRRSVAVLCMLYKIMCKSMHNVCGVQLVPYLPVWVTRSALVTHRYTHAPPRCRTSTAIAQDFHSPLNVFSCWTILLTLYSMVWDWCVIRGWPMLFCWL